MTEVFNEKLDSIGKLVILIKIYMIYGLYNVYNPWVFYIKTKNDLKFQIYLKEFFKFFYNSIYIFNNNDLFLLY